jgi:hypothetical protein
MEESYVHVYDKREYIVQSSHDESPDEQSKGALDHAPLFRE